LLNNFLNYLSGKEEPTSTVTYDCDPLIIVDDQDNVLYSGRIDVDFTPSSPDGWQGEAVVAEADTAGWQPRLQVQQRIDNRVNPDPHVRERGGLTWVGIDENGNVMTWYVGRAADTYVLNRKLDSE
jgi:hypothetical protein